MKKTLFRIVFISFLLFVCTAKVNAACSVSVSAPASTVVGSTFKVSTTVSSDVGSWYYVLSYDASKVQLLSGSTKVVGVIGDSKTNTYTFKSLKSGSTTFRIVNVDLASNATNSKCSASAGSSTINMKTQAEIEASYSRNNNLSLITVEGGTLSPEFSSSVTEYSVELPVDTEIAKINAIPQDKTATISGIGDIEVGDGLNKIEIVVTAQHGEKKTYVLNITVKEQDPIKVTLNGKTYSIVRKKPKETEAPKGFIEKQITIKDQIISAFYNEVSKTTLVNLKDEEGNIKLFIYEGNKYTLFNQVETKSLNLIILNEIPNIPFGFEKTHIKINDTKTLALKIKESDNFYLVYAEDIETGRKNYYLYDKEQNVFQRYFSEYINKKNKEEKILLGVCAILAGVLGLVILIKLFKPKKKKKTDLDDETFEIDKVNFADEPIITKVEEDEYIVPKKTKKQKVKEIQEAKQKLDSKKKTIKRVSLDEDWN